MWISGLDFMQSIEILKENFSDTDMQKVLEKDGNWNVNINPGLRTVFTLTKKERKIDFIFVFYFKERKIQVKIWDSKYENIGRMIYDDVINEAGELEFKETFIAFEDFHKDFFFSFKNWLTQNNVDAIMTTKHRELFLEEESFGKKIQHTYTGKESQKITKLMKLLPVNHQIEEDEDFFTLTLPKVFPKGQLFAKFSFYPAPSVDIMYSSSDFSYRSDILEDYTIMRCKDEKEIKMFYKWFEQKEKQVEDIREELFDLLREYKNDDEIRREGSFVTIYNSKMIHPYQISLHYKNFKEKFMVESTSFDQVATNSLEEALLLCKTDRKAYLAISHAVKNIKKELEKYSPKIIKTSDKNYYAETLNLYNGRIDWSIQYFFEENEFEPSYIVKMEGRCVLVTKNSESAEKALKEKLIKEVNNLRIRSLFTEKEST